MALLCAQCHSENPEGNRFCDNCGEKLPRPQETSKVRPSVKKAVEAVALPLAADNSLLWLLVIVALGAFLRLWELGLKPLHHDESIHSFYAWQLFKGGTYKYDPAYHGPLRYHLTALVFFIFGDSDFTTRILPASAGIGLIVFLWQWKSLLGKRGALFSASLVAISPTFTYVSRFIRDDILMSLGSMTMVWGLFRWYENRQNKFLYWMSAGFCLAFTSHEGTWIFMGIIGSFLFFRWLWERIANPVEEEKELSALVGRLTQKGAGKIWVVMLCIFFIPFTLLYSTFFSNMDGWFMGAFDSIAYWLGEQKTGRADQPWQFYIYMLALYELAIVAFAVIGGFRVFFGSGKPNYFWMKLVAFLPFIFAIFILTLYPKEPRAVLPMAALATLGSGMAAFSTFAPEKGNHFRVFLIYWAMLGYVMFTIAGERMPWLTLHPLTPLTLLAGMYLGEFFDREKPLIGEHWIAWTVLWLPISFFAVFLPRQIAQVLVHAPKELGGWLEGFKTGGRHGSFQPSGWNVNIWQSNFWTTLPWVLFVILVAATPFILEKWPKLKNWTRGTFFGLFILALATLSHGTNNLIFHGDGADPREQHVYVQSSVELVELAGKLERMSRAVTGGPYLKIACEDLSSWPMSWYLRDLKNAQIGFGPPMTLDKVKDFPVAITEFNNQIVPNHDQLVADSYKDLYNAYPVRFRRWWAPDKGTFFQGTLSDQVSKAWKLFMYREPWMPASPIRNPQFENYIYPKGDSVNSPYGSTDACVWVRKDIDRFFQ